MNLRWPRLTGRRKSGGSRQRLGSLRGQLLRWLLIPLLALVALDALSVYRNAVEVADVAYDRSLLASTRALAERVSIVDGKVVADVPYVALDSFETDTLGRIYYKVTGLKGEFVSGYEDLPPLPPNVKRSQNYPALVRFYHAEYRNQPVRIAALYQPVYDDSMRGIAMIQVGETMDARYELTHKILFDTLWRQGVLVTAAGLLVWFAVALVLRPLMHIRNEVETRVPTDLSGFSTDRVHKELRPLVLAMNAYMDRLQQLIDSQRRFIADASHQLRTPLTVLKTQAELALRESQRGLQKTPQQNSQQNSQKNSQQEAADPAVLRELVQSIANTTDTTVHLANRLLTMARTGHGDAENALERVSLTALARQVGLEMAYAALKKDLDLALEAERDVVVSGNKLLLRELLGNLLDNAIIYTPHGGKVTIRVIQNDAAALLQIEDSGAGLTPEERERVFAPFYRAPSAQTLNPAGAGLGLPIVRDIARLHHADIVLGTPGSGQGLLVSVRFPLLSHQPSL